MNIFKRISICAIKSLLWIIDKDHRYNNKIEQDIKKFTHNETQTDFYSDFGKVSNIYRTVPYNTWELKTETKTLYAADKHIVLKHDMSECYIEDLSVGDLLLTDSGIEKIISVRNLNIKLHMYDMSVNTKDINDKMNNLYYSNGILSHNTTCAAAYILWLAVTAAKSKKQTILITANKLAQAQEVLERIKYSYQLLPEWMQPGIKKFNERKIVFDNESIIQCRATTADAPRGLSPTLVYLDEMAFVPKRIAESFMTALKPTLSTGGKLFITSTPMNDEDEFAKIWKGATDHYDENGNYIEDGTGRNGFFPMKYIWSDHPKRDSKWEREYKNSMTEEQFLQEFECVTKSTKLHLLQDNKDEITMTMGELYEILKNNQ